MCRIVFGLAVVLAGCLSNTSSSGDGGASGEDGSTSSSGAGTSSGASSGGGTSSGTTSSSGSATSSGGSGGSSTGGSSSSGGSSSGTGVVITPDMAGYVAPSSNSVGIQGAWYGYGDCWGTNGAPPGDCENKGMHPASACSTITSPPPAMVVDGGLTTSPFTQTTPGTMCLSGTAAKVIGTPADYSNIFGIGIGLDFNNVGGVKMPYAASTNKVVGFSFHLAGVPTGGIRVEFPTSDTAMNGSDSYAITAMTDGDYTADLTTTAGDLHKLSLSFTPAPTGQPAFMPNNLLSIQFHVVPNISGTIAVSNLCVSNLKAIVSP